ncbi:MAG TPA: alpha-2-macroglobulin family protein, partial [Fimbriiglobus sp.]|nr:alpha-2-macroglobulin family protein [Fimbriiglobus sp.]
VEGFVLNAKSGEPVAGAKVQTWTRDNNNRLNAGETVATDKNGLFRVETQTDPRTGRRLLLMATNSEQALAAQQDFYGYPRPVPPKQPTGQTVLFTDRSLYRPGQTIHFKGICLRADQEADKYETLPNKAVNLRFLDVNGQEVAKLAAKTNDYGSFAGSFTAPRSGLTGHMTLVVGDDVPGSVGISVEEYKRPQFQVKLDAPKDPAKLGGDVTLTGKATAYTGAAVGGARVRYRVVREVRFPPWFHDFYMWRMPPNRGAAQEIAHGTAVTRADGSFPIAFTAKPDRTVPEKDEPTFRFTVTADVTDTNGETRSDSRSVNVGYAALQATVKADDWQAAGQAVKFAVTTTTLDGEGQSAKGTVKVHSLKQPDHVHRRDVPGAQPLPQPRRGRGAVPVAPPKPDPADPKTWEPGEVVATLPFTTDAAGKAELSAKLDDGAYRAVLETADKFDKPVTAREQVTVLNPDAMELKVKVPHLFAAPKWTLEPGQEFRAVWGTGYDAGRAFVEIEHRNKAVQAYWTDAGRTQSIVKQAIDEGMRGGFTVRVTYVRENRAYLEQRHVDVPWTNKELTLKWERFVSKLEPGKKETWTAVVSGPDAQGAVAEMVAALYDQSLDAYKPHDWLKRFQVFRQDHSNKQVHFENVAKHLGHVAGGWQPGHKQVDPMVYRSFPADLTANLWGYMFEGLAAPGPGGGGAMPRRAAMPAGRPAPTNAAPQMLASGEFGMAKDGALADQAAAEPPPPAPDLSQVAARSNLAETAFFFPHLVSDDSGTVKLEFTMPEALTKWKFLGFAHDNQLRSGFLGGETVTAKDLMVQPNPPRFLREGDVLEFAVKVTNQSDAQQAGSVRLTFADARTGKPVDADLGNERQDQPFDIPPKEARSFTWKISVPDGLGPITYKAVGAAGKFSDGEEGGLPVLSKRVLVTESLPLPIRGEQTKTFEFQKLLESGKSDSIKHQALTVQMTSNPAWYAVMALPYLMEYPYECSEQTFNRLYANALARHVAASDPKIRKVFDQWKNTPALDSPLEKNQDLKAAMLEETPWVRAARDESQARRNVGILFDENRLGDETTRLMRKLAEMQLADGSWPWFPGGPKNDYITLYIATGYGRLRQLGVKVDVSPAVKAVARLDAWADEIYREILRRGKPQDNHLSSTIALYLYGRSFFLGDRPPVPEHQEAINYWQNQARNYWLKLANRQSQAHLALALARFGHADDARGIAASIKERSVSNEELGMFWRDTELSWWWYHAPIETQALMIELFAEVADDAKSVEDCKVWLLKQKQTQNWKTTKATADAVYALLLRGNNLLKSDALVTVTVGGQKLQPEKVEAGTGFYEEKFVRGEVKPEMGKLTVTKTDPGVAWGGAHWQYLEDISKVTSHEGTPLKLEKSVYKKTLTRTGPVLEEVKGPVNVGDELVMRVVLRTDRDMEYVHLKDHRGSGTEPTSVLSRYKYQDGLAYYESTKDTASHFFIDYLPKGTYVFEYSVRAVHKGKYPTGLADIQCMYAPEFNSHSGSVMLEVK